MPSNNTGLNQTDNVTAALMNVRAARTMVNNGELADADAALNTAEICLLDGGAKDIGHIPEVGVKYDDVPEIIAKYERKIERLEYERSQLVEMLDQIEEKVTNLEDNVEENY